MATKTDLERWTPIARQIPKDQAVLKQPILVLEFEAVDVALFFSKYWKASVDLKTKQVLRPGLESVEARLKAATGDEPVQVSRFITSSDAAR